MSYFLWIEDFDNRPQVTAESVFGDLLRSSVFSDDKRALKKNLKNQGVFIELSFQDGLGFIRQNLSKIDYVILDIDLPAYSEDEEINPDVLSLLSDFQDYKKLDDEAQNEESIAEHCKQLKAIAGFYLYTELVVELGFPKQHILFCSNHAENAKTTRDAFKVAKIALPDIYEKSNPVVKAWIAEKAENPYSQLRRGVIEACQYLINETPVDRYLFNTFIEGELKKSELEDRYNYLKVLESFFPLRQPNKKNEIGLYKLFVRTLAHEWDVAEHWLINKSDKKSGSYAFASTMKIARNWMAHGKVFEQLQPQDIAYLFIINMRAMFDLGDNLLPYEQKLLNLFSNPLSKKEMEDKIGINPWKKTEDNPNARDIPLVENYALLLEKTGNTWQAINFHDALNNLQKYKQDTVDNDYFIAGLYKVFWFLTSNGSVNIPSDITKVKNFSTLNYQFKHFNYQPEYLFEIARHIYSHSFPQKGKK